MFLDWSYPFCLSAYLGFVLFLSGIILLQEGKGGDGLGGISSGGSAHLFLGTSAAEVLRKITGWSIFSFLISCIFLSVWTAKLEPPSILEKGEIEVSPPKGLLVEDKQEEAS